MNIGSNNTFFQWNKYLINHHRYYLWPLHPVGRRWRQRSLVVVAGMGAVGGRVVTGSWGQCWPASRAGPAGQACSPVARPESSSGLVKEITGQRNSLWRRRITTHSLKMSLQMCSNVQNGSYGTQYESFKLTHCQNCNYVQWNLGLWSPH